MKVTIFKDFAEINAPRYISVYTALERIREGKSAVTINAIREKVKTGTDYDKDKKRLPFVVFSAAATKEVKKKNLTHRLDECVTEHSGLFSIDFDNCDTHLKTEQLRRDPYVFACWISPSGNGVRALVKCPASLENHELYYTAFLDRYPDLDPTSRNIARGTFESYDPDLYQNDNSLVWDKRLTEEDRRKKKEKEVNKRSTKVLATAASIVRASYDGIKHESLLKAANLLGGYIATNRVTEEEAIKLLEDEIRAKHPKDLEGAKKTIREGIEYGKSRPLHETKKIERALEFLKRDDGSYDFLADNEEMTEYEKAVIDGTLEMGLVTGLNDLNQYWMFKKHHLCWFGGIDNVGKSFVVWYFAVLTAMLHDWKVLLYSSENRDGTVRKKLKELYLGKSLKVADDEELTIADDWVKKHFRIMTSKQMHNVDDMMMKAEIVYDEGFEFDVFIAEPYNSFEIPRELDTHRHNLYALNRMRIFTQNYSSIWVCDHVNSAAARTKDKDGYIKAPWKSEGEGGQIKANKVDDYIMIHRLVNHPEKKYETELHVQKIKDKETGGSPTPKDFPVVMQLEPDFCGYVCDGQNPVQDHWKSKNK